MRQIAKLAGLSPSAVSLALRQSPKISAVVRRRVQALAERLGYRPNAKVRELMTHLRASGAPGARACFGVVSFYEEARPWERALFTQRIYEAMRRRADELAYRLEPIWLRQPGMTYRRIRAILDARKIEGLVCFGSPDLAQQFPAELDHYAIVTFGQSIRTSLHRVVSHFYSDTWRTLDRLYALGYRRPGLVLGRYEDLRTARACASAYLGWGEQKPGVVTLPVLRLEHVEEAPLHAWLQAHRPDVMVFVHVTAALADLREFLRARHLAVPRSLGVAVVSQIVEGTGFSGMQQNQRHMGAWAVELLAARIANRDFGIPKHPRIEMVEGEWIDGGSLRTAPRRPRPKSRRA